MTETESESAPPPLPLNFVFGNTSVSIFGGLVSPRRPPGSYLGIIQERKRARPAATSTVYTLEGEIEFAIALPSAEDRAAGPSDKTEPNRLALISAVKIASNVRVLPRPPTH